ncbi:MAG: RNA pseudouridine synthase [Tannerella sp.]|nr:RNA pseudouridine synthase [Tannerella sp.]
MLHFFKNPVADIPLPLKFTNPFSYVPHSLCVMAAEEVRDYLNMQTQWTAELAEGKMFGVLIVQTLSGEIGYLAAFSGNLAHENKHDFFVTPVYDLLDPTGFFVPEEKQISEINRRIDMLLADAVYMRMKEELENTLVVGEQRIMKAKSDLKQAKAMRNQCRTLNPDKEDLVRMVQDSQFQKAELKRLERSTREEADALQGEIRLFESQISALKEERATRSFALQKKLFDHFRVLNARGDEKGLLEIFEKSVGKLPPAGAGECAAPKLLQYAYRNQMRPLAMAEFWREDNSRTDGCRKRTNELRWDGYYYPACKGKCEPILNFMLQGIDVEKDTLYTTIENAGEKTAIVFEDEWLVAINKPPGMLSVPGKETLESVYSLMQERFPNATGPLVVHRLDMDTSGLMLLAKTKEVHEALQRMFAARKIKKTYLALLDGMLTDEEGEITLPLCPDPDNRPMQIVHYRYGKQAISHYKVLRYIGSQTLVEFCPLTGRTHQLRVHAAHPDGLNSPIHGDRLYGQPAERLYLHAYSLEFIHPVTGEGIFVAVDCSFVKE